MRYIRIIMENVYVAVYVRILKGHLFNKKIPFCFLVHSLTMRKMNIAMTVADRTTITAARDTGSTSSLKAAPLLLCTTDVGVTLGSTGD